MSQDIHVVVEHLQGQVADITYVMLAAGRIAAQASGGKLKAVLLGYNAQSLAGDLGADGVVYVDDPALADFTPDAYKVVLAQVIEAEQPRAVLCGDTSIGAEIAGGLSARLNVPLVSNCLDIRADDGALRFVSRICGGKILAEGMLPEPTALVTMVPGVHKPEDGRGATTPEVATAPAPPLADLPVKLKQYIEPESGDVDLSREELLIAVGRGVQRQDNLELAEELAVALGGTVCASRPIVDQGWLPTTRLVGKSGKKVKAKLYLALGISGAPEHVEGITDSETIIAVNVDPAAPIFSVAKYGTEIDMLDLLPALSEQVQQLKGG